MTDDPGVQLPYVYTFHLLVDWDGVTAQFRPYDPRDNPNDLPIPGDDESLRAMFEGVDPGLWDAHLDLFTSVPLRPGRQVIPDAMFGIEFTAAIDSDLIDLDDLD